MTRATVPPYTGNGLSSEAVDPIRFEIQMGSGLGLLILRQVLCPTWPEKSVHLFQCPSQALNVLRERLRSRLGKLRFIFSLFDRLSHLDDGVLHGSHDLRMVVPEYNEIGKCSQQNQVPAQKLVGALLLKRARQAFDQLRIEASSCFIRRFVDVLVQIGRHAQRCADVVVLGHGGDSTRRLQNGIDTKMKPIYINCTASF